MKFLAAIGMFALSLCVSVNATAQDGTLSCFKAEIVEATLTQQGGMQPTSPRIRQPNGDSIQTWASADGDRLFIGLYTLHPVHGLLVCPLRSLQGLTAGSPEI